MAANCLKLNDEKTDFIILGSNSNLHKCTTDHITTGNANIQATESVKNIGAILDKHMKCDIQMRNTCKNASLATRT